MNLHPRIISLTAAVALAVATLATTAPAASAETLHVGHAKTVKITPETIAPTNAKVARSVITVKKGSKTVAKDTASYKAKKGTYKVVTTVTYQLPVTATPAATDVWSKCRITAMAITSDRTDWNSFGDGTGYYAGQVTFAYTGTCADTLHDQDYNEYPVTWTTSWQEDDYIMTDTVTSSASRTNAIIADADYGLGDVDYVDGTDMSTLPTYQSWSTAQTVKSTRTVKVKN